MHMLAGGGREGQMEGQRISSRLPLSLEPEEGLDLRTPRSRPKPKSRASHLGAPKLFSSDISPRDFTISSL